MLYIPTENIRMLQALEVIEFPQWKLCVLWFLKFSNLFKLQYLCNQWVIYFEIFGVTLKKYNETFGYYEYYFGCITERGEFFIILIPQLGY
jgi:hypothetical protein